ncbi:minichromosome maintenance protein 10, partial [Lecanoromycetidae sp. Uapishka_2]
MAASIAPRSAVKLSDRTPKDTPVEEDDEDDEETLELKLAAIEAKLKLKKLQQKTGKAVTCTSAVKTSAGERVRPVGKENAQPQTHGSLDRPALARPKASADVQVPISPQRKRVAPEEARSPGRVLLGIDKGLKGRNISLRRPVGEAAKDDDPFRSTGSLGLGSTLYNAGVLSSSGVAHTDQRNRPKSFSEKIAETRKQDKAEKDRADKLRRQRSSGFGVKQQEIENLSQAAEEKFSPIERRPQHDAEFSRDEILKAANQANGGLIHRSITSADKTSTEEAVESEQNTNGKYMVLTLTDLKWTVDLFLFTTAYTRFRKLTPGTVVALLNPDIMPPPPGRADTGRFSLKLASSDDTVLEIGTSRDLAWCKSVRKDGKQCSSWIDKRHTEFCEFHVDVVVERTRRGRMEVQGMSAPFAPGGRKGGRTGHFGEKRRQKPPKEDGLVREGAQYDRGSSSRYFVGPPIPGGRSAAQLIDAEGAIERGGSKEERVRKRLAEREKENEIARKLGEGGNGAGSDYLRMRLGGEASLRGHADPQALDPVDATSLGLLGNRATNVHLSPIKKRKASGMDMEGSRKKTRFVTDRGIKEAGRESLGGDFGGDGQREDDDELEVI